MLAAYFTQSIKIKQGQKMSGFLWFVICMLLIASVGYFIYYFEIDKAKNVNDEI